MRYLLLSSCLLLLLSCAGVHKNLQKETGEVNEVEQVALRSAELTRVRLANLGNAPASRAGAGAGATSARTFSSLA